MKPREQQNLYFHLITVMKGSAAVLGVGYGIKGFKHIPAVQKAALKYFENMKANDAEKFAKLGIKRTKII